MNELSIKLTKTAADAGQFTAELLAGIDVSRVKFLDNNSFTVMIIARNQDDVLIPYSHTFTCLLYTSPSPRD